MTKIFEEEIKIFYNRLTSKQPFSFSKYADGEWMAMNKIKSTPGNGEWIINPEYQTSIDILIDSFRYKHEHYYVGISCPCCQGDAHFKMKDFSSQDEDHLTFANIFVNSNYQFYLDNFIQYFSIQNNIYLVANEITNLSNLPFKVERFYPISYNAWVEDLDLIEVIKKDIQSVSNKLFLFSAGPFGNILAHQLWNSNKNNQYLDVGSTIDPWTKANRIYGKYYYNTDFSQRTCRWE